MKNLIPFAFSLFFLVFFACTSGPDKQKDNEKGSNAEQKESKTPETTKEIEVTFNEVNSYEGSFIYYFVDDKQNEISFKMNPAEDVLGSSYQFMTDKMETNEKYQGQKFLIELSPENPGKPKSIKQIE